MSSIPDWGLLGHDEVIEALAEPIREEIACGANLRCVATSKPVGDCVVKAVVNVLKRRVMRLEIVRRRRSDR